VEIKDSVGVVADEVSETGVGTGVGHGAPEVHIISHTFVYMYNVERLLVILQMF
jgi:hypothetical protein